MIRRLRCRACQARSTATAGVGGLPFEAPGGAAPAPASRTRHATRAYPIVSEPLPRGRRRRVEARFGLHPRAQLLRGRSIRCALCAAIPRSAVGRAEAGAASSAATSASSSTPRTVPLTFPTITLSFRPGPAKPRSTRRYEAHHPHRLGGIPTSHPGAVRSGADAPPQPGQPARRAVAVPERGLVYGNRGCLHDAAGTVRRHHNGRRWIACRLRFRGWHRSPLLQPGRFTELFFLDEATAFAAGHRPCALCRRGDYNGFGAIWSELHPGRARRRRRSTRASTENGSRPDGQRRHEAPFAELPDGAMVLFDDVPQLVVQVRSAPGRRAATPRRGRSRRPCERAHSASLVARAPPRAGARGAAAPSLGGLGRRYTCSQLRATTSRRSAYDRVAAGAAVDHVALPVAHADRVVARIALDPVAAETAVEHVVARAAAQRVVAATAEQRVVSSEPVQDVCEGVPTSRSACAVPLSVFPPSGTLCGTSAGGGSAARRAVTEATLSDGSDSRSADAVAVTVKEPACVDANLEHDLRRLAVRDVVEEAVDGLSSRCTRSRARSTARRAASPRSAARSAGASGASRLRPRSGRAPSTRRRRPGWSVVVRADDRDAEVRDRAASATAASSASAAARRGARNGGARRRCDGQRSVRRRAR